MRSPRVGKETFRTSQAHLRDRSPQLPWARARARVRDRARYEHIATFGTYKAELGIVLGFVGVSGLGLAWWVQVDPLVWIQIAHDSSLCYS